MVCVLLDYYTRQELARVPDLSEERETWCEANGYAIHRKKAGFRAWYVIKVRA
jgi:hypothetical protein